MADTADFLRSGDLHRASRHLQWSPELILIAFGSGEIDRGTFVALGGCPTRFTVRDLMLFQPPKVHIDVLGSDVKSAPGHIRAQLFSWWIVLGLQKRADATRAAVPPHEAEDRRVLLSHIRREPINRPWRKAGGFVRPVSPGG